MTPDLQPPFCVDVLIPLYNNEKFIGAAVSSALGQTYPVRRVIVVDDGSTDRSAEIVERDFGGDPRVCLIRAPHLGRSAARNRAIAGSHADYVAFLDSDDFWDSDKLKTQMLLFAANPALAAVYCGYRVVDEEGRPMPDAYAGRPALRGNIFKPLLESNRLSGSASAMVVRRSLFARAGVFDETFSFGEDWDMWLRLAKTGAFDFAALPLASIRYRAPRRGEKESIFYPVYRFVQHLRIWSKWPQEAAANPRVLKTIRIAVLEIWLRPPMSGRRRNALLRILGKSMRRELAPAVRRRVYAPDWFFYAGDGLRGPALILQMPGLALCILAGRAFPRLRAWKSRLMSAVERG